MATNYYIELLNTFPPRPIIAVATLLRTFLAVCFACCRRCLCPNLCGDGHNSKAELIATQNRINSILDQPTLAQVDRDYLKVLGMLIYDYEETHEPIPTLQGINLLKALIEEAQLEPKDLAPILESETIALEILNHQREISDRQADELAAFFHVSPQLLRSVKP